MSICDPNKSHWGVRVGYRFLKMTYIEPCNVCLRERMMTVTRDFLKKKFIHCCSTEEENKEQKNEKEYVGKRQNKDIEKDIRTEDNFEV